MAIEFNHDYRLCVRKDDGYSMFPHHTINLKTGRVSEASWLVLYAPGDVKKLARAKKIGYMEALRYFELIGIDDHNGANIYVPRA